MGFNYIEFTEHPKGNPVHVRDDAVYIVREVIKTGPGAAKVVRGHRIEGEPVPEGSYCQLVCARGVGIDVEGTMDDVLEALGRAPQKKSEKAEKGEQRTQQHQQSASR
jgi:hypothetical protein